LDEIEKTAKATAKRIKDESWKSFNQGIQEDQSALINLLEQAVVEHPALNDILSILTKTINPARYDAIKAAKATMRFLIGKQCTVKPQLVEWLEKVATENEDRYNSNLHSSSEWSALKVKGIAPTYSEKSSLVDGREVLRACFAEALERDPRVLAFGEDVGKIGDVNQGFAGLQEKFGELTRNGHGYS